MALRLPEIQASLPCMILGKFFAVNRSFELHAHSGLHIHPALLHLGYFP